MATYADNPALPGASQTSFSKRGVMARGWREPLRYTNPDFMIVAAAIVHNTKNDHKGLFQRRRSADDLADLLRDLCLPGAVVLQRQGLDHFAGVFRGSFHRDAAGDLLTHRRIQEALEEPNLERHRQYLLENFARAGEELVLDRPFFLLGLFRRAARLRRQGRQWQQRLDGDDLPGDADEFHVRHLDAVDLAGDVVGQVARRHHVGFLEGRLVLEVRVILLGLHALKAEVGDRPLAGELQLHVDAFALDPAQMSAGFAQDRAVVAAAQAAIGAEDQQNAVLDLGAFLEQRVLDVAGIGAEIGRQLRDLACVGVGLNGAVHRLLEARGGDQLHRPRDLADIPDRLTAFHEYACAGHGSSSRCLFLGILSTFRGDVHAGQFVKRLRREISAIRPNHGTAFFIELRLSEILARSQRREDWAGQ